MSNEIENNVETTVENTVTTTEKAPAHGMAIGSLVLGIIGVVFTTILCCLYWPGVICSAIGLVLAIMANKQGNKTGVAKAGLILSIIGLIIGIVWVILGLVGSSTLTNIKNFDDLKNNFN